MIGDFIIETMSLNMIGDFIIETSFSHKLYVSKMCEVIAKISSANIKL